VPEFWLAAVHEAGHVASHLTRDSGIVEVWIAEDGTGSCQPHVRGSVVSALAGMASEWKLCRPDELPDPADFRLNTNIADIRHAVALLGSDRGDLLLACWIEARRLIDREWRHHADCRGVGVS